MNADSKTLDRKALHKKCLNFDKAINFSKLNTKLWQVAFAKVKSKK
jgi:hypothetical protein